MGPEFNGESSNEDRLAGGQPEAGHPQDGLGRQGVLPPPQALPAPQTISPVAIPSPLAEPDLPIAAEAPPAVYPPQPGYPPAPGYPSPPGYFQPGYAPQPAYPPSGGYEPSPAGPPPAGYGSYPAYPSIRGDAQGPWPPAIGPSAFGYWGPLWTTPVVQPGPMPGLAWAGIGIRLGALIIDAVVALVIVVGGTVIADQCGVTQVGNASIYSPAAIAVSWIWIGILLAYVPTFWWVFRGTIGQLMLGLQVVRAADGKKLGIGATTIRYIVWLLCTCTILIGIVASIVAADKPDKRAWPDDASGSVVVKRV